MSMIKQKIVVSVFVIFFPLLAVSQQLTESLGKMSDAEAQKLRQTLSQSIDASMAHEEKLKLLRAKDQAAVLLNDMPAKEANLLEWVQIDPTGKWMLRAHYWYTGQLDKAIELGRELVMLPGNNPYLAVLSRTNLAKDYVDTNQLDKAKPLIEQAEEVVRYRMGNYQGVTGGYWKTSAEVLLNRAKAAWLLSSGKWSEAERVGQISIDKAREMNGQITSVITDPTQQEPQKRMVIYAYADMVKLQSSIGHWANAQWTLRDAYELSRKAGYNESHMYLVYVLTSKIKNGLGAFDEALVYASKAEALQLNIANNKADSSRWMEARVQQLTALAGQGRWEDALKSFQEVQSATQGAQVPAEKILDPVLLGFVLIQSGNTKQAESFLASRLPETEAMLGPQHFQTAMQYGLLAVAQDANRKNDQAIASYDVARRVFMSPSTLTSDFVEDELSKKIRQFILEKNMQSLALQAKTDKKVADLLFRIADQVNSSSVQGALNDAAARASVGQSSLAELIRKEQDAKQESASLLSYLSGQGANGDARKNVSVISQMQVRLHQIEKDRKILKEKIQKDFPDYFNLVQPKAPSLAEIAQQLAPDETFVSIVSLSQGTYIWAVQPDGATQFHASTMTEKGLSVLVDRVRKTLDVAGIGSQIPKFDATSSHEIYKQLIHPVASALSGKAHLIFSTSGPLAQLPFAVLLKDPLKANEVPSSWLIRDHAISHVPSASGWISIKRLAKKPSGAESLMAWGDPQFAFSAPNSTGGGVRALTAQRALQSRSLQDGATDVMVYSKIPPLPETRDEVLNLAKILSANPSADVLLGAQATRRSVLDANQKKTLINKRVLVFATHGLLAGDLPNVTQPALAMASTGSEQDSPLLTLEDVLTLNINADWVVLSACNTAGADGRAKEAMSGLARGFFYAGSRSLLVTHWSVESESAMFLTTRTFAAYQADSKIRRSEALRQSMLETMKSAKFSHPAYWAPYALVGEGGR